MYTKNICASNRTRPAPCPAFMLCLSVQLGQHVLLKELLDAIRMNGMELIIHRNADTLSAFAHAENTCQLYRILKMILADQSLQLLDYLAGALDMK